ncbi:phage major tail protein, phi13 family [Clostridium acidisoli DSM 12555]|uniref:Phage major tail protein, phi13 family n=1 Tax=Clostridium acidisoli DSM 12555 TaxID=1121291 RepID=A0A1W1X5V7_9CLOT|nr:major tail protein [Clostridium acidisoli]SMC19302.1 phage major tail protein, phi13 family [Clostridium acidisoli DSM 12555]
MAKINIDRLFLATITKDELGSNNLTFATPEYIPGIQQFSSKAKTNTGSNYEEGKLVDQDITLQDLEISIDLGHFSNQQYAKYLGHSIASTGGVFCKDTDVAPWVSLLVEYTKAGGVEKGYLVLYKGKLVEPDIDVKQAEGKVDYQNSTVTATFQPLTNNGMYQYMVETDDPDCPEDIATTFFASVIVPTPKTVTP